jgi:hypothetical protein
LPNARRAPRPFSLLRLVELCQTLVELRVYRVA